MDELTNKHWAFVEASSWVRETEREVEEARGELFRASNEHVFDYLVGPKNVEIQKLRLEIAQREFEKALNVRDSAWGEYRETLKRQASRVVMA